MLKEIIHTYMVPNIELLQSPIIVITLFIYLLTVAQIDYKEHKIPDTLNKKFFKIGLILIFLQGLFNQNLIGSLSQGFFGAIVGFLIIFIPAFIANVPMGGDMKCFTTLGLYLGPHILTKLGIILCICILSVKLPLLLFKILFNKGNIFYRLLLFKNARKEKFPMGPWILTAYTVLIMLGIVSYI